MTKRGRLSGFGIGSNPAPTLHILRPSLGQSCPAYCPSLHYAENALVALGEPMPIRAVSEMLGCSAWTVRQRYIPEGLPYLRSGPAGKLVFFRNQVTEWILQQQAQQKQTRKGGR